MNLSGFDLLKLQHEFDLFPWGKPKWETFTRTEQIWVEYNDILSQLCHFSKNLWNEANYQVRQELFAGNRIPQYCNLAGNLKTSDNFKSLNAQTAQQILRVLSKSWKAFFKSLKEFSNHPDKFLGRPNVPVYKPKDGEFILIFTNQQVKIEDGYLKFPKNLGIDDIKTRLEDDTNIREARIIPKGTGYVLEIVYEKRAEPLNLNSDRIIGIDFGLRNIVTIGNNIGEQPIVIKGSALKSMNQYYNKRKIKDVMHKISRYIVNLCIDHNIGTIVIGHNDNWKQEANLGRRNNQNFVSIPYYILTHDIQYKAEEIGIKVIDQEEAHTSKCSFLDNEPVEHHEKYLGKRIKRGLFRSAKGIIINADVNGSLNIIRKAIPNAFINVHADGIEGVGLHPKRANINMILSFADGS